MLLSLSSSFPTSSRVFLRLPLHPLRREIPGGPGGALVGRRRSSRRARSLRARRVPADLTFSLPCRRGRRGGGTASGGEGGGDTPTSSEASAGGTGGGTDEGVAPTGSAYNTPTASLAALSSPTSDVTPSPEVSRPRPRPPVTSRLMPICAHLITLQVYAIRWNIQILTCSFLNGRFH